MTKTLVKKAGPNQGSTDNFESGMAQLSRQSLQNRSPLAAKGEVGFQLLDKNDDGDAAVGVFGLRLGRQLAYAPAFFINGEIKTEHLYLIGRDQFVPLSDKWVQAASKGQASSLGRSITRQQTAKGLGYQDLTPLLRTAYKSGSLTLPADLAAHLPEFAKAAVAKFEDFPTLRESLLKRGVKAYTKFAKYCSFHPSYVNLVDKVYGTGTVEQIIKDAKAVMKAGSLHIPGQAVMAAAGGAQPSPLNFDQAQASNMDLRGQLGTPPEVAPMAPPEQPGPLSTLTGDFQNWTDKNMGFLPNSLPGGRGTALIAGLGAAGAGAGLGYAAANRKRNHDDTAEDMSQQYAEKMSEAYRRGALGPLEELVGTPKQKPKNKLTVTPSSSVVKAKGMGVSMPDDVVKQAIANNYVVRDARESDDLALPVPVKNAYEAWCNPAASGMHNVITSDGDVVKCAIFMPEVGRAVRSGYCLVIAVDGKDFYRGINTDVIIEERDREEAEKELQSWFESQKDASISASEDSDAVYAALGKRGEYSTPFTPVEKLNDGLYSAYVFDRCNNKQENQAVRKADRWNDPAAYNERDKPFNVRRSELDGKTITWLANEIVIPDSAKVIKLGDRLKIGSNRSFYDRLRSKSAGMTVQRINDFKVAVNGFERDNREAALHLANDWCISYSNATEIVKSASHTGTRYCVVPSASLLKEAQGPFEDQDQGLVQFQQPPYDTVHSSEQLRDGRTIPTEQGTTWNLRAQTATSKPNRYESSDGGYGPSEFVGMEDMERAQQGGREIFDVAALAPLMDAESTESMVDDGLSDLFKGLHRIMSILFSLYRRNDQFVERYGDQDARQLEESLRTTATKVGDLILFLKQKDVDPMPTPNPGDLTGE